MASYSALFDPHAVVQWIDQIKLVAFWYGDSTGCSVARLATGICLQFRQEEIFNFAFLRAY